MRPASEVDRGEKPFIRAWGEQSTPKWSPDGRKIAFVSTRTDHSFIVVYDVATRHVKYMSPSVDFDSTPLWTADSKRLVFVRRPGLPFGQQAQQGGGGIGNPNGPAFQAGVPAAAGRGGPGRGAPGAPEGRWRRAGRGRGENSTPAESCVARARADAGQPSTAATRWPCGRPTRRPARRTRPGTTSPTTACSPR